MEAWVDRARGNILGALSLFGGKQVPLSPALRFEMSAGLEALQVPTLFDGYRVGLSLAPSVVVELGAHLSFVFDYRASVATSPDRLLDAALGRAESFSLAALWEYAYDFPMSTGYRSWRYTSDTGRTAEHRGIFLSLGYRL